MIAVIATKIQSTSHTLLRLYSYDLFSLSTICHYSFLNQCRPKSVSMGNAIKYVKMQITHIPADISDAEVWY